MSDATGEKPHISATQLDMGARCWQQWYFRYALNRKVPPRLAQLVGGGVHSGIETNFRQKQETREDLPAADIVEAAVTGFEGQQASQGCLLTTDEKGRGLGIVIAEAKDNVASLAALHAQTQAPDYQPTAVEHQTRIAFPNATHDLLAVTDLRDEYKRVIDFKTAKRKTPQRDADQSLQLTIYAVAFLADNHQWPAELALDVLVKTKKPYRHRLSTIRAKGDLRVLANRVNVSLAVIQSGIFPPASPGHWVCSEDWCGYTHMCPYYYSHSREV